MWKGAATISVAVLQPARPMSRQAKTIHRRVAAVLDRGGVGSTTLILTSGHETCKGCPGQHQPDAAWQGHSRRRQCGKLGYSSGCMAKLAAGFIEDGNSDDADGTAGCCEQLRW